MINRTDAVALSGMGVSMVLHVKRPQMTLK